jgi:hypothetical protein
MTTAAQILVHAVMAKTAQGSLFTRASNAVNRGMDRVPDAAYWLGGAGGAGAVGTAMGGPDRGIDAGILGLVGGGVLTKGTRHALRGGDIGQASRDLELGNLAASPRWKPSAAGGFDYTSVTPGMRAKINIDPANPRSVAEGTEDLATQKSTVGNKARDDIAKQKGALGLLGSGVILAKNYAGASEGAQESDNNPNNVRAPEGGTVTKVYWDEAKGKNVVQYKDPKGQDHWQEAPMPNTEPATPLKPGDPLKPGHLLFRAPGLSAQVGQVLNRLTGAAGQSEQAAKAIKGTAQNTETLSNDLHGLVEPAKAAMGAVPAMAKSLDTAAGGVAEAGRGVGQLGEKAGTLADTATQAVNDVKGSGTLRGTVSSIGNAAGVVNRASDAVTSFMHSDQAKMVGGGVAALGLAYILHKMFSRSRDR